MAESECVDVTVVVAACGRADALRLAVESVQLQTYRRWALLVIGDKCDDSTSAAMQEFRDDRRIVYVNLPWRCGEQSLLNSAGMATAHTEYVAFLNHDDVWMPQHLEIATNRLRTTDADFFLGRAAIAVALEGDTFPRRPQFQCISPLGRTLRESFWRSFEYVEPASAWVVRRSFAARVGPWRRAATVHRVPILDWVLRAWRAGGRLVDHERVTCLKIQTHGRSELSRKYDSVAEGQAWCVDAIARGQAGALESLLVDLPGSCGTPMPARFSDGTSRAGEQAKALGRHLLTPEMADLYFRSGLDAYDWLCAEAGIERGERWRAAFVKRTGEMPPHAPELAEVIAYVAETLTSDGLWLGR
jgi:hypothetical protein